MQSRIARILAAFWQLAELVELEEHGRPDGPGRADRADRETAELKHYLLRVDSVLVSFAAPFPFSTGRTSPAFRMRFLFPFFASFWFKT